MTYIATYLPVALAVVGAAAAIAAVTPTPKDDGIVKAIRGFLDVIALNVGNAKNKDQS